MKKIILSAIIILTLGSISQATETCFNPSTQGYDMNGESKLTLWGVSGATNGLTADAKNGWHTELAVASWYANLLKAQEMSKQVDVGYDPNTFEIWYVGHPKTCTP